MDSVKMDQKYKEARELPPADIKLILLGDSAVGKSKYVHLFLTLIIYPYRLVERFLLNDYEERTSSTHALTMYRHNCNHKGQDYKVGKYSDIIMFANFDLF